MAPLCCRAPLCAAWLFVFLRELRLAGALQATASQLLSLNADAALAEPALGGGAAGGHGAEGGIARTPLRQALRNSDGHGLEYVAEMTVGGQEIRGILDTGSYELLVFSSRCQSCGDVTLFFDSSNSPTFEGHTLETVHSFGSGDTFSQLAYDRVTFRPPLSIEKQYFWEVVEANLPVLSEQTFQAIIGVGPPSTPHLDSQMKSTGPRKMQEDMKNDPSKMPPPKVVNATQDALTLVEAKTVLESLEVEAFSVCLRRQPEDADGIVVWYDDVARKSPAGIFARVPVISQLTWGVSLSSAMLQAQDSSTEALIGCQGTCSAIVDSGTSLLVAPLSVLDRALQFLNELEEDCSNMDAMPNLVFQLGGQEFSLPPEAYIGQVFGQLPGSIPLGLGRKPKEVVVRCEVLILPADITSSQGEMWILGMPFLREYYTTFEIGPNIWDKSARSLSMARAGDDCHPSQPGPPNKASMLQPRRPRTVDLSRVQLPAWVVEAMKTGWMDV